MNNISMIRKILAGLLTIFVAISSSVPAYAATSTPNISGAFSSNSSAVLAEYMSKYGWNDDVMRIREWDVTYSDGTVRTYERQAGFQLDFVKDNIKTTRIYLGLDDADTSGGKNETTAKGGAKNIVAVATAEANDEESIESPLGSNDVKYNTWYYGSSVQDSDTKTYPWAAVFVSYCAAQAGYIKSRLYVRTNDCNTLYNHMVETNGFNYYVALDTAPFGGSQYTPKAGDLFFFCDPEGDTGYCSVGIISSVTASGIYVIQGDVEDRVQRVFYGADSDYTVLNGTVVEVDYPASTSSVVGSGDREPHPDEIFAFLTDIMGFTEAAACGAMGCLQAESGCIPDVVEYGYTWETGAGYGLPQWTNTNSAGRTSFEGTYLNAGDSFYYQSGLRRTNLVNYCVTHGLDYTSLYGQLEYLSWEIDYISYFKSCVARMNSLPNTLAGVQQATSLWFQYIEGSGGPGTALHNAGITKRVNYAVNFWNKYS